jgi:hypothetical protein
MNATTVSMLRPTLAGLALVVLVAVPGGPVAAAPVTECTALRVCYCMNSDFRQAIDDKVAYYRSAIAAERAKGKAIGYLSVPLSTAGGSYFGVNRDVAAAIRARVEARYGESAVWLLNPTAKEADLPPQNGVRAGQGDYMVMWTRILEGARGLGEDFDFVYFAGPSDFAAFFALTGKGDLERIAAYFGERVQKDADLARAVERGTVTAAGFRNYYGLRASASFSAGAHDEWNVIREVNAKRRGDAAYGVVNQLPVFFDGRAASSAEAEQGVAPGNAGACRT